MEYGFLSRAGKFLQEQKKHRRWMIIFLCLAGGVTLGTLAFLKLYGQAMTHQVKMLQCQCEVHVHTEDCYEENEDGDEVLVCEYADYAEYVIHVHNDDCYDQKGNLVCPLEEHEFHEHDDDCLEEVEVLICGEEETKDSQNAEDKSGSDVVISKELACEKEEHKHNDRCYESGLGCVQEVHTHNSGCYDNTKTLTCEESEHIHDDGCYSEGESVLTCGKSEHEHDDSCEADSNLICKIEEHEHDDSCYIETEAETEKKGTSKSAKKEAKEGHTHTDDCYETEEVMTCGELELHMHDDSCYDEDCYDKDGNLIEGSRVSCGLLQLEEHVHTEECFKVVELTPEEIAALNGGATLHVHSDECYDEDGNLICGHEVTHLHSLECYDEDGNLICGFGMEEKAHEHDANCYDMYGKLICSYDGAQDHVHTEACYDEDGNLICGYVLREEYANSRTFEGGNYVVIVKYDDDANIPEEAELLVEEITPDSDKEHYERREMEYREILEDEMASMRALLKIGFYMETEDGKTEIEPEVPVMVSVQFLDEDGLPEGRPVTVIHFAEEGTEMLDGGSAIDNSTTFTMESFSEIAIGYVPEEEQRELTEGVDGTMRLHLADFFEYEDDAFQITFHVEGEAILPEDTAAETEAAEAPVDAEEQEEADVAASTDTEEGTEALAEVSDETNADIPDAEQAQGNVDAADEAGAEVSDGTESAAGTALKTEKVQNAKLRFKVEHLDKNSAEYQAFQELAEKTNGAEELYRLQVMTYSLTYGGEELDLSRCKVTAEIRPTQKLEKEVKKSIEDAAAFLIDGDGNAVQSEVEAAIEATPYLAEEETTEGTEGADTDAETGLNDNDAEDKAADASEDGVDTEDDTDAEDASDLERAADAKADESAEPETYTMDDVGTEVSDGESIDFIDDLEAYFGDSSKYVATDLIISASLMSANNKAVDRASVEYDGSAKTFFTMNIPAETALFAVRAEGQPNPEFTVQYYANLNVLAETGTNEFAMIDTSGKKLPVNGKTGTGENDSPTGAFKYMYVDNTGTVQTVKELTEVYSSRNFEYHKAPTINYMNALVKNSNYELKEVWVLKGGDATSIDENDWEIHIYNENLHFTNRKASATGKDYIHIDDGAVIRFVYETTTKAKDFSSTFYDYDISNGRVHRARPPEGKGPDYYVYKTAGETFSGNSLTDVVLSWAGGLSGWDGHLYAYTQEQGINSSGNYSGSGTKLAFGNANTGTGLGRLTWSNAGKNNELNKYNNSSYQGCTFGLVTGMSGDKIQYDSGVQAPNLFNEGTATGKTEYTSESEGQQYSLKFNRVGDTYTLSAVNETVATNLGNFSHPTNSTGTHTEIWTNNFWPMDSAPSFGTGTHDVKFGGTATFRGKTHEIRFGPITQKGTDYTFPESDDGKYHNSYFGMRYEVEFDLVKDYVGPLEYYFFGDDDMWVFLDGKLVCDIGGVHSSVGEYVNLWDYLDKGTEGKHKLSFFYTERGASGSTCWMRFTLPSVSSLTPETTDEDYGELRVEKTVTQVSNGKETVVDNNDEFTFTIELKDKNGNKLPDDYSYLKYDKNGTEIGHNLIVWDGAEFTLKNGEYIIVKYLPLGTMYKITESNQAFTVIDKTSEASKNEYFTDITVGGSPVGDGNLSDNKTATGEISKGDMAEVKYNNKFYLYGLPKTGGPGTILYTIAGALFILLSAGFLYKKKFRERRV